VEIFPKIGVQGKLYISLLQLCVTDPLEPPTRWKKNSKKSAPGRKNGLNLSPVEKTHPYWNLSSSVNTVQKVYFPAYLSNVTIREIPPLPTAVFYKSISWDKKFFSKSKSTELKTISRLTYCWRKNSNSQRNFHKFWYPQIYVPKISVPHWHFYVSSKFPTEFWKVTGSVSLFYISSIIHQTKCDLKPKSFI